MPKKLWYVIIDHINEEHPTLQLEFTISIDDFATRKARNKINQVTWKEKITCMIFTLNFDVQHICMLLFKSSCAITSSTFGWSKNIQHYAYFISQTRVKKLGDFGKKRFVSNSYLELAMESSKQWKPFVEAQCKAMKSNVIHWS